GTGLMIAAWEGNLPMMELFVQRGARLDAVNKNGEQALQLAAYKGHFEAVKWLLDRGAPLERRGNEWGALHYAAFNGHRELAQYLISRGANVNARAPNLATSLMLAAREGRESIAEDLVKAGADPSLTNDLGETPLVWAMRHGNVSIAKLVSSPEAFANAVRNPVAQTSPPMRSVAAPQQIEDLLRRIRQAEGQNLPTAGLRKQLATALVRQREEIKRAMADAERQKVGEVKAIVITAQRKGGGEKAEVVYSAQSPAPVSAAPPALAPAAATTAGKPDNIQLLLARIRAAKARGEPTDELRKQLMDAVSGYRE
ncbi:MAG: ankyrin repeat domain-containing protein, partial [Rhodocyclaceae bacterium]|nr:ankyrin repeat domain-containing protein [Rhodocyclaceae bacterium]